MASIPTIVDRSHSQQGGDGRAVFDRAITTLRADVATAGAHLAIDGQARATYDRLIATYAAELRAGATQGRITWLAAADQAQARRNDVMAPIRSRSTPVGRAFAQRLKREGRTLNELIARKTVQLFGRDAQLATLGVARQDRVYAAIVASAGRSNPQWTALMRGPRLRESARLHGGRSNPQWTALMRGASAAGRALLVLSLAIAVYDIASAGDHLAAARHEGAVFGGGIVGGAAGGALAGLACGPGAPVCVTVGAFVGGTLAAFGVGLFF